MTWLDEVKAALVGKPEEEKVVETPVVEEPVKEEISASEKDEFITLVKDLVASSKKEEVKVGPDESISDEDVALLKELKELVSSGVISVNGNKLSKNTNTKPKQDFGLADKKTFAELAREQRENSK